MRLNIARLFMSWMITYVIILLPIASHARKFIKTDLLSVIGRSKVIVLGKCVSYQCVSNKTFTTLPLKKCETYNSGVNRIYSVKVKDVVYDRNNILESKVTKNLLNVSSNRSDMNSVCGGFITEFKNRDQLLYLSYNKKLYFRMFAVFGNLLYQDS
jgi:hypothetical protein